MKAKSQSSSSSRIDRRTCSRHEPWALTRIVLCVAIALFAFATVPGRAQDGPVLSLRFGAPARGRIAGLELTSTGDLLVTGWFSDHRPGGNAAQLLSQAVVLTTAGQVVSWTLISSFGTNAYANGLTGRLDARFSDGSLLVSFYSAEVSNERRIRVFPDGRPDTASPKFPLGRAGLLTDGSLVVGIPIDEGGAFDGPLLRYTLHDDPLRGSVAVEDSAFRSNLASQPSLKTWRCVALAPADDGGIWTLLDDAAAPNPQHRLFRFLAAGQPDGLFQPARPILAADNSLVASSDGSVLVRLQDSQLHLRRIRKDGTEDPAFRPQFEGSQIVPLLAEPRGSTLCQWAGLWPDDPARLVRLTATGEVDPAFVSSPAYYGDSMLPRPARRVLRRSDGRMWVAYGDWDLGGVSFPIRLLNPDGSVDPVFNDAALGEVPTLEFAWAGGAAGVVFGFEVNTTGALGDWRPLDGTPYLGFGFPGPMALYRPVAR